MDAPTLPNSLRSGAWPLALSLATFVAAWLAWASLANGFPDRNERPSQGRGITHWVGDGVVPLTIEGRLEGAKTLAIGDSRIWMALDRGVLDDSDLGRSSLLWGSGGDLRVLLAEAAKLSPQLLIVGLSPHSMGPEPNRLFVEVARKRAPVFAATTATPAMVRRWKTTERAHLLEKGFPDSLVTILLNRLQAQFQREYDLHHRPTVQLTTALDAAAHRVRFDHVYTLKPDRWRST